MNTPPPPPSSVFNINNGGVSSFTGYGEEFQSPNTNMNTSNDLLIQTPTGTIADEQPLLTRNSLTDELPASVEEKTIVHLEHGTCQDHQQFVASSSNHSSHEERPSLQELWKRGLEHNEKQDSVCIEESQASKNEQQITTNTTYNLPTAANDTNNESDNQQRVFLPFINKKLLLPLNYNTSPQNIEENNVNILHGNASPPAWFRHPFALKWRQRYQSELARNTLSSRMGHLKDYFGERPILLGPYNSFHDHLVELSLLCKTPEGELIFAPCVFYNPNMPDEKKFSNPIIIQPKQDINDPNCIPLDLMIAKQCQRDQLSEDKTQIHWTKDSECTIRHYPSGETKTIPDITPRQLFKKYDLNKMLLGVRRGRLCPDGISFIADPNFPTLLSNSWMAVDSNDSPSTWDYSEHKLKITKIPINSTNILFDHQNQCKIKFSIKTAEIFHCTLTSNRKVLRVALMTDNHISNIYKIGFENGAQNPAYFDINLKSFDICLTIVKEILSGQQNEYIRPTASSFGQVNNNQGVNRFYVEFCLQDRQITNPIQTKSYDHSTATSDELIDINGSVNFTQYSHIEFPESQETTESILMHRQISGKRRHEDSNNSIETLPVTIVKRSK